MSKRNMYLGGVVVVIVIAAVVVGLTHKSTKPTPAASSTAATSSPATSATTPASTSIISTKSEPRAGQFIADSNNDPLYTYGGDTSGVSNCSGACIADWPVYGPTSSTATLPTNVTVIQRSDGKAQYAYKGMPLYTFSSDGAGSPGGDGLSNFHLARP